VVKNENRALKKNYENEKKRAETAEKKTLGKKDNTKS
jgi:hypothetical protein